ncbi:polyprenyl synthetase [Longibacter salinarum]|uniref:Polyprenyl synthetase n=1 Tax=Longibacter salinarum TaxID=1850348 RepID=A0A2A8D2J4_9BACT|nr:polyprenyl synthetase family protein [Longibacter salinarum]PEN15156.1 polyprenyl synthetase [Longibacter salinarum]
MIESPPDSKDRVDALRNRIDEALIDALKDRGPDLMYDPIRYVLRGGGKRVRPVLLTLVAQCYGADLDDVIDVALAVEVFHNFTLVHDDIMDDADERRGRASVHIKWDEGTAILAGDLMLALSYELLTANEALPARPLLAVYNRMVEQLCVGQRLDTHFETQDDVSVDDYLEMIDGKTAALLSACFELGAIAGGAPKDHVSTLSKAGRAAGRAFQIQDDLLDVTADSERWGKAVGGDLQNGKRTYVTLKALEIADGDDRVWFARLLDGGILASEVPEARQRMERLGVFDEARAAVQSYTEDAFERLSVLPEGAARSHLQWLLETLQARSH